MSTRSVMHQLPPFLPFPGTRVQKPPFLKGGVPAPADVRYAWAAEDGESSMIGAITDSNVVSAAQTLQDYLTTNGAKQGTNGGVCSAFQSAWNSGGGTPQLTQVDDEYGPCTQAALQAVWDSVMAGGNAGPGQQAPQNAYPGHCSNGTYVAPHGGGGQITPSGGGSSSSALANFTVFGLPTWASWLLVGTAVVAAGYIVWSLMKHPKIRYRLRPRRHRAHESRRHTRRRKR